jgi:hypothetical protein
MGEPPRRVVILGGTDSEWRFCSGACSAAHGTRQAEAQLARFIDERRDP